MLEPINISLESLNLGTIAPVSIAIIGALGILLTDIFNKNKDKSLYVILVVLFLIFDLFTLLAFNGESRGLFDLMLLDGIAILSQCIIVYLKYIIHQTQLNHIYHLYVCKQR